MTQTRFNRIAGVDNLNLSDSAYARLADLSRESFVQYCGQELIPQPDDIVRRAQDADCLLVSWRTPVTDEIMSQCPSLKYIGLCASKYTNPRAGNIDLEAARRRGVVVSAVGQYGDEATAEFIFSQLLILCRGFGKAQWKSTPCELYGKKLGIVGMGAMGSYVLRLGLGVGMKVVYNSRTRKPEVEAQGVPYVEKSDLLRSCDIVSLHVPKATTGLSSDDFALMKSGTILVQTCLGIVCDAGALHAWLSDAANFAIMDESVDQIYKQFQDLPNVLFPPVVAGRTGESRQRLSDQVLENLEAFLDAAPVRIIN